MPPKKKGKEEVKVKTPEELCQEKLEVDMKAAVGIHKASYYGMTKRLEMLCAEKKVDPDKKDPTSGNPAFMLAAKNGHLKEMKMLKEKDVDCNGQGFAGVSALHTAAAHEHLEIVQFLLTECDCTAELQDDAGNTAMHYAAKAGHLKVVDVLCEAGANLEQVNKPGMTPMLVATLNNRAAVVEVMFKRKCDVKAADAKGDTALHIAASCGYEKLLRQLLAIMPQNMSVTNKAGKRPDELTAEKAIKDLFAQFSKSA